MRTRWWMLLGIVAASLALGCSDENETTPLGPSAIAEAAGGSAADLAAPAAADATTTTQNVSVAADGGDLTDLLGTGQGVRGPAATVVRNLTASATDVEINLAWDAPSYETATAITDYRIRLDWTNLGTTSSSTRTYRIRSGAGGTSLVPGTTFRVQVRAVYGDGLFNGRWTTIHVTMAGTSTVQEVPWPPGNPTYSLAGNTITLRWLPSQRNQGSTLLPYEVRYVPIGGLSSRRYTTRNTRPIWSWGPHDPGQTITYYVRAVNANGASAERSVRVVRPALSSTRPEQVRNLTVTATGADYEYTLAWTRPSNHSSQDPVTMYHYYYGSNCTGRTQAYHVLSSDQRNRVNFSGTVYSGDGQFSMKAENSAGIGNCKNP